MQGAGNVSESKKTIIMMISDPSPSYLYHHRSHIGSRGRVRTMFALARAARAPSRDGTGGSSSGKGSGNYPTWPDIMKQWIDSHQKERNAGEYERAREQILMRELAWTYAASQWASWPRKDQRDYLDALAYKDTGPLALTDYDHSQGKRKSEGVDREAKKPRRDRDCSRSRPLSRHRHGTRTSQQSRTRSPRCRSSTRYHCSTWNREAPQGSRSTQRGTNAGTGMTAPDQ